jgi:hypothetical protein
MKKQAWIYSPLADGLFVLAPPLLTLLVIALLPQSFVNSASVSPLGWVFLVLAVDVAHVYSSLYRTYFDPETLKKHKSLLFNIPFVVFILGVLVYSLGPMLFWRMLAYVAVFHFIRQQYGFMRIYSRKEVYNKFSRVVDSVAIYSSTVYPILYWHLHPEKDFDWFVSGDFLYFSATWLVPYLTAVYLFVLAVYVGKEAYFTIKNKAFSLPKNAVVAGTYLSWYFGIVHYNGDIAFTALNILSHGIPYMALVWFYGRKKYANTAVVVDKNTIVKKLFSLAYLPVFIGLLLVFAFVEEGLWDAMVWAEHKTIFSFFGFLPHVDNNLLLTVLVPLLAVPQFTHYVIDGFIWKIGSDNYNWKKFTLDK